jgi:hypothetical protein
VVLVVDVVSVVLVADSVVLVSVDSVVLEPPVAPAGPAPGASMVTPARRSITLRIWSSRRMAKRLLGCW